MLRVVQPALVGMIDGTVSSIAPIFAAAVSSNSHTAFVVGLSTALGAGISMGISEALSDTGESTGRGSPIVRGTITGGMTALGGIFHTLPFLIADTHRALIVAGIVVAVELFVIAWVRQRFLDVSLRSSLIVVTLAGAIVLASASRSAAPESPSLRENPLVDLVLYRLRRGTSSGGPRRLRQSRDSERKGGRCNACS